MHRFAGLDYLVGHVQFLFVTPGGQNRLERPARSVGGMADMTAPGRPGLSSRAGHGSQDSSASLC